MGGIGTALLLAFEQFRQRRGFCRVGGGDRGEDFGRLGVLHALQNFDDNFVAVLLRELLQNIRHNFSGHAVVDGTQPFGCDRLDVRFGRSRFGVSRGLRFPFGCRSIRLGTV